MRRLGNYTDAEDFGKQSIAVCEKVWGTESADYLIAAHLLAETYVEIARYAEAETLLNHILQVRESAFKTEITEMVACLNLLRGSTPSRIATPRRRVIIVGRSTSSSNPLSKKLRKASSLR